MNLEKIISNPLYFKFFLLRHLPLAWFTGMRIVSVDNLSAEIALPYRRINFNPFKTIYFASMAIASEFSTGVLLMRKIHQSHRKISMFVIDMKGDFHKRGLSDLRFVCEGGQAIDSAIEQAITTGDGQTIQLSSTGYDQDGDKVCQFDYLWSIKVKVSR